MSAMDQRQERVPVAVRRSATRVGPFMVLAMTWATEACGGTSDCFDVHPGNRVAITVNALDYTPATAPSGACGFGFDMTQGLVLVATDLGNPDNSSEGPSCGSAIVAIAPFGAWTWTATRTLAGASDPDVLAGSFKATNGTCTGITTIDVIARSSLYAPEVDPFAAADAGQGPNVMMDRTFTTQGDGGAGCPSICSDTFLVTLKRL